MHAETQRSIAEFDFQGKVILVENRDMAKLGQYVGFDFPNHRDKLHCY